MDSKEGVRRSCSAPCAGGLTAQSCARALPPLTPRLAHSCSSCSTCLFAAILQLREFELINTALNSIYLIWQQDGAHSRHTRSQRSSHTFPPLPCPSALHVPHTPHLPPCRPLGARV